MAQSYEGRKGNIRLQDKENELEKWWKWSAPHWKKADAFLLGGKNTFEKMDIPAAEECCSKIKTICNSLMHIRKMKVKE